MERKVFKYMENAGVALSLGGAVGVASAHPLSYIAMTIGSILFLIIFGIERRWPQLLLNGGYFLANCLGVWVQILKPLLM